MAPFAVTSRRCHESSVDRASQPPYSGSMNLQVPPELEAKLTRLAAETGRTVDQVAQASLDYKQRLQQLFFPEGVAFDGNRFNRTALTAPLFK